MMPLRRPGTPRGGDLSGHDEYTMWDAAYVLGSLSSVGRREFEAHMADCPLCPSAIGELSGLPALLSQLDRDEMAAIDEANRRGVEPLPPDELLPTLLAKVNWRRRRSPIVTWTAGPPQPRCWRSVCSSALRALTRHPAHYAAGERGGSADGAGRDEQAGLDGLTQQPAVGNVHLDELRLPGPGELRSRQASDGRGRSRR